MRDNQPLRFAILVEYDGTSYRGSQLQGNGSTIQGALERALSSLTSEPVRVSLAGRTDAGVHARAQVASFLTGRRRAPDVIVRAANALLPRDIAVRAAAKVPLRFDPRRDAQSRWYRYTYCLGKTRPALLRNRVWHVGPALDLQAMAGAAQSLIGRHDFAAFAPSYQAKRGSSERVVCRADIVGRGQLAFLDIEANAFLAHMVRRIAAAFAEVGQGKLGCEQFRSLVAEARPGAAAATAPARGLCLMKVRYEGGLFDDETDDDIQP